MIHPVFHPDYGYDDIDYSRPSSFFLIALHCIIIIFVFERSKYSKEFNDCLAHGRGKKAWKNHKMHSTKNRFFFWNVTLTLIERHNCKIYRKQSTLSLCSWYKEWRRWSSSKKKYIYKMNSKYFKTLMFYSYRLMSNEIEC